MFSLFKKKAPRIVGHPVHVATLDNPAKIARAQQRVERLDYAIQKHGADKVPELVAERDVLKGELQALAAAVAPKTGGSD